MGHYVLITTLAMSLAGYMGRCEPALAEEVKPAPEQPVEPQQSVPTVLPVLTVSRQPDPIEYKDRTTPPVSYTRYYDWNGVMQPVVSKILEVDGATVDSVLPVDSANSRTSGSLNTAETTETLRNAPASNGRFTLVSVQQLLMAKQQLGLPPQDSLGTRSGAIGIVRNVGVRYVLYLSASGNVSAPTLQV